YLSCQCSGDHLDLHSFPTRRSSDLEGGMMKQSAGGDGDMSMSRVRSRRAALHGWQAICCMAVMTTFTLPSQASDDLFVPGITDGPTPWTHADFNNEADN